MDIKPPPKRVKKPVKKEPAASTVELPFVSMPLPVPAKAAKWTRRQWTSFGLVGAALALLTATLSVGLWYHWALQPRTDTAQQVRVVVEPGETATTIASNLYDHDLIKSRLAFNLYVQLSGQRTKLQAGGYVLSPNQDIPSIVEHMTTGKTDEFNITIPPGLTLEELRDQFIKNGFSDSEVVAAMNAS
jgi:cell division protein YceG involved in septum cleavage